MNTNPKDKQFQMQQIMQAKNTAAAKLFEEALNTEQFPIDKLSDLWIELTQEARRHSAPMAHRIGLIEFKKLVNMSGCILRPEKMTLFQFGILSNSIETVSQKQLSVHDELYEEFLSEAIEHIEWYGKRVQQIREEVQQKIDIEFNMKDAALKNGGLKRVIGEA